MIRIDRAFLVYALCIIVFAVAVACSFGRCCEWPVDASIIIRKCAEHQGTIEAANEKEAIEKAAKEFSSCAKDFLRGRNDFVFTNSAWRGHALSSPIASRDGELSAHTERCG